MDLDMKDIFYNMLMKHVQRTENEMNKDISMSVLIQEMEDHVKSRETRDKAYKHKFA